MRINSIDRVDRHKVETPTMHVARSIHQAITSSFHPTFELYLSSNIDLLYFCEPTIPKGSLNPRLHLNLKSGI
jgi:hypothetical protein